MNSATADQNRSACSDLFLSDLFEVRAVSKSSFANKDDLLVGDAEIGKSVDFSSKLETVGLIGTGDVCSSPKSEENELYLFAESSSRISSSFCRECKRNYSKTRFIGGKG